MESIFINYSSLPIIGEGYESKIYLYNNYAIKIFNDIILNNNLKKNNKIKKLEFIHDKKNDNLASPLFYVCNHNNEIIGFGMNYINPSISLEKIILDSQIDLSIKIDYCIKLCKIINNLNQENLYVIDNNFRNFLLDLKSDKLIVVDSDSISTQNYRTECLPTYFSDYYISRFQNVLDDKFTKYTLSLQILYNLSNHKIVREDMRFYNENNDYLRKKILELKETKNIINKLNNFFESNNSNINFEKILVKLKDSNLNKKVSFLTLNDT